MPRIMLKETVTKEIEIPIRSILKIIDSMNEKERKIVINRAARRPKIRLSPFRKDNLSSVVADFRKTGRYKDEFLADLENGLKKSSVYR